MATTKLHNYTVQEKLNKMDVDLIDVVCAPDYDNNAAQVAGDLLFQVTKIPNAVAVPGGTAILHSIVAVSSDPPLAGGFDLVITSDSTALIAASAEAETGVVVVHATISSSDIDSTAAVIENTIGFVSFASLTTLSTLATMGSVGNLGLVCKAESGSRDLYVYGIVQNTADYDEGRLLLRFGFIKD